MSVTSSTARIEYYIGDFDLVTGLTLPTVDDNSLTLYFDDLVSDQLSGLGGAVIYVLFRVTLNGTQIYKNADYDSPATDAEPSNPDITINVFEDTVTTETVTINNFVPMVQSSGGTLSTGTYSVQARFVYENDESPSEFTYEDGTFSDGYGFSEVTPTLFQKWNTGTSPFLQLGDSSDYDTEPLEPTWDSEFILYPPENKAAITTEVEDVSSIQFTSFWTGNNEVTLTTLFEYDLTSSIINYVVQKKGAFTIYDINDCAIFECLDSLYTAFNSSECGTKKASITEEDLLRGTSLAQMLLTGQYCGTKDLASIVTAFEGLCDCDCDCLTYEVVEINSPNTVSSTNLVEINATDTTTEVDLSLGTTFIITLSTGGGTTELQATNITQYSNYRIILKRGFSTQEATFESGVFADADGDVATATTSGDDYVILDFFAVDSDVITLVSRNDA